MIRVIIAGEGRNELGGYADEPAFRHAKPEVGVIEAMLRQVRPDGWCIVDAIPWKKSPKKLESWVAAIAGVHRSEELRRPEEKLTEFGVGAKDTAGMVQFVEQYGLQRVPEDARSLRRWLERAERALCR